MGGIAGVFFRDGRPVEPGVVETMLGTMNYRGPDGSGVWTAGSVGLGCLMLRSTPESLHEKLPKMDLIGRFVVTADARIDNRNQLIARLEIETLNGCVIDDSKIILAAHEKWGDEAPAYLEGDFAYCVWDSVKKRLFCSRDGFGVRPFYYYLTDKIFAFGSEIRPLLELTTVPRRLNETMVGDYLIGMQDDQAGAFYQDILRLPPGHCITVSSDNVRARRYWALDPTHELKLKSDGEYAEAFHDLFVEAVRSRLRSAYPVATYLSGGLDSSSVTCVARDVLRRSGAASLTTLSVIYDQVRECDEREFMNFVVAQGAIRPLYLQADDMSPFPYINLTEIYDHDDPFDAPNSFSGSVMTLFSEHGIRVVLDGFDGDNTVSHGTSCLAEFAAHGRLISLIREIKALSSRSDCSFWDLMWRKAIRPLTPAAVRRTWRAVNGCGNRPWPKGALISKGFADRIGLAQRYREFRAFHLKPMTNAREEHCRSLSWGGLTHQLEGADKLSARHGIETRHPFFDRKLAEFCVALPSGQKMSDGWTRLIMRRAMVGLLPEEIRRRPGKADFLGSYIHAIVTMNSALLETAFHDCQEAVKNYVDPQAFELRFRGLLARPMQSDPSFLWPVLSLGLWLNRSGLRS